MSKNTAQAAEDPDDESGFTTASYYPTTTNPGTVWFPTASPTVIPGGAPRSTTVPADALSLRLTEVQAKLARTELVNGALRDVIDSLIDTISTLVDGLGA